MENNVEIDASLCTGCGACAKMCPAQILYVDQKEKIVKVSNDSASDRLGGCMRICPTGAIKIKKNIPSFAKLFKF